MISIDTDVMRQLVQTATNANNAIVDAVEVLNQITVHNDWACKERKAINDYTIKNKKLIKELQENAAGFLNVLTSVASEFDGAEKTIIDLFQNIESVLAGVLGSAIWGNISTGGNHNHNPLPSITDILDNWDPPSIFDDIIVTPDGIIMPNPVTPIPVNPFDNVSPVVDEPPSHVTPDPVSSIIDEVIIAKTNLPSYVFDLLGPCPNPSITAPQVLENFNPFESVPLPNPYVTYEYNNFFDSIHICDGALDLVPSALDLEEVGRAATAVLL